MLEKESRPEISIHSSCVEKYGTVSYTEHQLWRSSRRKLDYNKIYKLLHCTTCRGAHTLD